MEQSTVPEGFAMTFFVLEGLTEAVKPGQTQERTSEIMRWLKIPSTESPMADLYQLMSMRERLLVEAVDEMLEELTGDED